MTSKPATSNVALRFLDVLRLWLRLVHVRRLLLLRLE
jgi:hypothetical protein